MRYRFLLLLVGLFSAPLLSAQVSVTGLTHIAATGGAYYTATGINSAGDVVGNAYNDPFSIAFVYSGGITTHLGTLGGTSSYAYGINASGQIVGAADDSSSGFRRAYIYQEGAMSSLGALGSSGSYGHAINASGQVAGESNNEAFFHNGSSMVGLGVMPGDFFSTASAINASGQIAGTSGNFAFLYSGGVMTSLGALPEKTESVAHGINASGQIVGYSGSNAFLYSGGTMHDLGTLGGESSVALGINDAGHIVGRVGGEDGTIAFFYADGTMYDLNSLAATFLVDGSGAPGFVSLETANALNGFGQIVGHGQYFDGSVTTQQAFLLEVSVSAIPEPSTYAAIGGALAFVVAAWRRRRIA